MRRILLAFLLALCAGSPALGAGAIVQSGPVTAFHPGVFFSNGVLADAGTIAAPYVNQLGLFNGANCPFGISSQTTPGTPTGQWAGLTICQTNTQTIFSVNGYGGLATPQVYFDLGGTLYPLQFGGGGGGLTGTAFDIVSLNSAGNGLFDSGVYVRSFDSGKSMAIGLDSMSGYTNGVHTYNIGIGNQAARYVAGDSNIGVGPQTLGAFSGGVFLTGNSNAAFGRNALIHIQGIANSNTGIGVDALYNNTIGVENTALGYRACIGVETDPSGVALTGSGNTCMGVSAGVNIQGAASVNTFAGSLSGASVTTGAAVTAIGALALNGNGGAPITTNGDVALGYESGFSARGSSTANVFIGFQSAQNVTSTQDVIAIGDNALAGSTGAPVTGLGTIAIGALTLANLQGATAEDVCIGYNACRYISTGAGNTGLGAFALGAAGVGALTGNNSTAIGDQALYNVNGASNSNTAVGANAGRAFTTGTDLTAVGNAAAASATTATAITAIGSLALNGNGGAAITGLGDVAVGYQAGYNSAGASATNVYIGYQAGLNATTGANSVAIGTRALAFSTTLTGSADIAIGDSALAALSGTTTEDVCIGHQCGLFLTTGQSSTGVGSFTLGAGSSVSLTGDFNTAIGDQSLYMIQGVANSNTALGYGSGRSITTGIKNTIIGALVASTTLTTGGSDILIGTASNCDTAAAGTSNYFAICASSGSTPLMSGVLSSGSLALAINALVTLPTIGSDATHTDATVCEDTTSHLLLFGSGASGVCLGTSSRDSKVGIVPIAADLLGAARIPILQWHYRAGRGLDSNRLHYGPIADDVCAKFPDLCVRNKDGKVSSYDWPSMMWAEIAQLRAANDNLARKVANDDVRITRLEARIAGNHK